MFSDLHDPLNDHTHAVHGALPVTRPREGAGLRRRHGRGRRLRQGLVFAASCLAATTSYAQDARPFGLQIGLGVLATTGTTTTRSIDSQDNVHVSRGLSRYDASLSYDYVSSQGQVSTNRLVTELTDRRSLDNYPDDYGVAALRYDHNPLDGYNHYWIESVGLGHRLLMDPAVEMSFESGVGLRQDEYPNGTRDNGPVLTGAARLLWHLSQHSEFSEHLRAFASNIGTTVTSISGLTTPIRGALALKVSETLTHYSSAQPGFAGTTTLTSINLIYQLPARTPGP